MVPCFATYAETGRVRRRPLLLLTQKAGSTQYPKGKLKKDRLREQSLMQALSKQKESRIVGETLPSQQRAYRVRVVKAFYEKAFHWPR